MTLMRAVRLGCAVVAGVAGCLGGGVQAQPGRPAGDILARLAPGQWLVHARDGGMADTRMCLADGRALIQLRHGGLNCHQFVVKDEADTLTVSYTCGTAGSGMTRLRRENDSLVQIETQGIDHGLPFSFTAEARRVGVCHR